MYSRRVAIVDIKPISVVARSVGECAAAYVAVSRKSLKVLESRGGFLSQSRSAMLQR